MARIGERIRAGSPAPVAGTYQCTQEGCTAAFKVTIAGAPLPPPHHPGAAWKLTTVDRGAVPDRGDGA